mmetsp:Transcript_16411/g.42391  ORF Transcript_16411/g.42391 Transcript_16411/m.42391 type:complete len:202 (+) Transcript_16411:620-1225(+)
MSGPNGHKLKLVAIREVKDLRVHVAGLEEVVLNGSTGLYFKVHADKNGLRVRVQDLCIRGGAAGFGDADPPVQGLVQLTGCAEVQVRADNVAFEVHGIDAERRAQEQRKLPGARRDALDGLDAVRVGDHRRRVGVLCRRVHHAAEDREADRLAGCWPVQLDVAPEQALLHNPKLALLDLLSADAELLQVPGNVRLHARSPA